MKFKLIVFGILGLLLLNLVFASFEISVIELKNLYGPGEEVQGIVELGFNETPGETLLTGFDSSITLKEFLDNNDADYSCVPEDCEKSYSIIGAGDLVQEFSLGFGESKLIGINLAGEIYDEITKLDFYVSSDGAESCVFPLQIDILDDGIIDWVADKGSEEFGCIIYEPFGCFDKSDSTEKEEITNVEYCETINLPLAKTFKIGAIVERVKGTDEVNFTMSFFAGENYNSCEISTNSDGEISCNLELNLESATQADVCIKINSDDEEDFEKYKIRYEDVEPCGYTGIYDHDFEIFARVGKYGAPGNFKFNGSVAEDIEEYILNKYGDCDDGCVIPIKFKSGIEQTISVSNLEFNYKSQGFSKSEKTIYEIEEKDILINFGLEKLSLEHGHFAVPLSYGKKDFKLKLGDEEILKEEIEVSRLIPNVKSVVPSRVSSLVSNTFIAIVYSANLSGLKYSWDFGDGLSEETDINMVKHIYNEIGTYELIVSVENKFGKSAKTIEINVVSPKDKIPSVIDDYNKNLDGINSELNSVPVWIRTEIEKKIDVDGLKNDIAVQSSRYGLANSTEDYIKIMTDLVGLNVPESLKKISSMKSFPVFMDSERLDVNVLEGLGLKSDIDENQYTATVNGWLMDNLDVFIDSEEYYFAYNYGDELIASNLKISLTPKKDLDDVYFIIDEEIDNLKFAEDYSEEDVAGRAVITFDDLINVKVIEFLYPDVVEIGNFPVYITSGDEEISLNIVTGIKCGNGVCDENENSENCREDCKPFGITILFFALLIFGAFGFYIILQEWYKKHYESRLFPNKNQLFNLINFMNTSMNQGLKKKEILGKLKEMSWKKEQLIYAWKKLNGKKTGMWEIPVFKWVENKKVKKEIEKRKGMSVGNVRPRGV